MSAMLGRFPAGSPERAATFFQAYLGHKTCIDPHVQPQVEYLIPLGNCQVPMEHIGKTETMQEDFENMFAGHGGSVSFNKSLGQHPISLQDKQALESILGRRLGSAANVAVLTASTSTDSSKRAMATVLSQGGAGYLRALCWVLLPDFAAFGYKPPAQCPESLKRILAQQQVLG
jgi:hypothetical protein